MLRSNKGKQHYSLAEKAFDRGLWPYIFESCKGFGFLNTFINWLKVMYHKSKALIRVNGAISQAFDVHRGTRQGDPLSPFLFALSIEPLAESIRQQIHKLALYADDIILFINKLERSLPALISTTKIQKCQGKCKSRRP